MIVPALVAAGVLAVAGAAKVLDPTMTIGALRQMGLPSSALLVRLGAMAELALGVGAVVYGARVVWFVVALSYVAFSAFVVAALGSGRPIGSCGCFGRADTPPAWWHAALTASAAAATAAYALG